MNERTLFVAFWAAGGMGNCTVTVADMPLTPSQIRGIEHEIWQEIGGVNRPVLINWKDIEDS